MSTPNCLICKCMSAIVVDVSAAISSAWLVGKYGADPENARRIEQALELNKLLINEVLSTMHKKMHEIAKAETDKSGVNPGSAQRGTLQ